MLRPFFRVLICALILIGEVSCKHTNQNSSAKIINGEIANPGHWTVTSTVALTNDGYITTGNSYCSGTVIAPYAVLTAAHCMRPRYDDGWHQIVWGSKVLGSEWKRRVAKRVRHPKNTDKSLTAGDGPFHDLAIYLFADGIPNGFAPAILVDQNATYQNDEMFYVAGYGNTKDGETYTNTGVLRWTDVKLKHISEKENDLYLVGDDKKNTCKGDSGGPVYKLERDNDGTERHILVGVTSFGRRCDDGSGHYVDIRAYLPWIDDVLKRYKKFYDKQ